MLNQAQIQFLTKSYAAAKSSGHIFPEAAAAETALESSWGTSKLCLQANNLFGLKKPESWTGPTISIPTREYLNEQWVTVPAVWPVFPDWQTSYTERMHVLLVVPRYASVLGATTIEDYIFKVSHTWATDPERAANVLSIYNHHKDLLQG